MNTRELLRESLVTARAQPVPTVLVALIAAAMCAASILTVGRAAAAEEQIRARLDDAGTRVLTIADQSGSDLVTPTAVAVIAALSTVERAVGTTLPVDAVNGAVGHGGTRVPSWGVVGDLTTVATLVDGRLPNPGEAVVSRTAREQLGLDAPAGFVVAGSTQLAVVGEFVPRAPFDRYESGLLFPADDAADTLAVVTHDPGDIRSIQTQVVSILGPAMPTDLQISSPASLADLQAQIGSDLGAYSQALLFGVLAAGGALTCVVVTADVLLRRRDLGRRRALGADRATTVALILVQTAATAGGGGALGTTATLVAAHVLDIAPPMSFGAGVAVLAVLTALVGAVLPSVTAAWRDPVTVLRTA